MSEQVRGRERGKLLTVQQVAAVLGVRDYTVRRLCTSGQLVYLRVNGATGKRDTYRVFESDLDDYIERIRVASVEAGPTPEQLEQAEPQAPAPPARRRRRPT